MYLTVKNYLSDGAQRDYPVPFPVIKQEYVKVYKQAADEAGVFDAPLEPVGFIMNTPGMVRLGEAVPEGMHVILRRETFADSPLVDFQDAAILTKADLNLASLQALHIAQEAKDQNGSNLDAAVGFFRILQDNLEKVIAEGAAIQERLKGFITEVRELATQTKNLINKAEDAVKNAASCAEQSRKSSGEAQDSEYWARLWANEAPGVEVKDGKYSSRHYADAAKACSGDLEDHVGAEDPHPQYLRKDQAGSGIFEVDANGDIQIRVEITVLNGGLFYVDAWNDIALFN